MSGNSDFSRRLEEAFAAIPPDRLTFNKEDEWAYGPLAAFIERYAAEKELLYTAVAARAVKSIHDGTYQGSMKNEAGLLCPTPVARNCFNVCRLLINLHLPIPAEEEDILLSSALLAESMRTVFKGDRAEELRTVYHFNDDIFENVLTTARYHATVLKSASFDRTKMDLTENRTTILMRLADCSCVVEKLYTAPVWRVRDFIRRTREFYLPLCCYAKERFPELIPVWSIFMDKIKTMTEATDILITRYEQREFELQTELLSLKDENATIRGFMRGNVIEEQFERENGLRPCAPTAQPEC